MYGTGVSGSLGRAVGNGTATDHWGSPGSPVDQGYNHTLDNRSLSNSSFEGDDMYDVPPGIVALLAFLYGSISLLAIVGNGLVILVIVRNKKMQSVTNLYIANLAFADVMIGALSIPFQFQAALLQKWVLPNFLCSLVPFVQTLSVNISVFTLTMISIDRYFAVIHPLKPRLSRLSAKIITCVIWVIALGSSLPVGLFQKVGLIPSEETGQLKEFCQPHWPSDLPNFSVIYHIYLFSVQYVLPLAIITFAYARIGCRIWGNKTPGSAVDKRDKMINRNKRKVVKMLIIVVCLFVLCWMPLQIYHLLSAIYPDINLYPYINIIWFCSNWLAMSNSCYNPFIYGLLNQKFKNEFLLLLNICPCSRCHKEKDNIWEYSEDSLSASRRCATCDESRLARSRARRYRIGGANHMCATSITEQSLL